MNDNISNIKYNNNTNNKNNKYNSNKKKKIKNTNLFDILSYQMIFEILFKGMYRLVPSYKI